MGELVKKFGIDPLLLLAQLINFGIVLFVLWKFAYKPVLKVLHERQAKVAKSIADAKAVEQKLAEAEALKQEKLREAQAQARTVVEEAVAEGERYRQQRLVEVDTEMQTMRVQAQAEIVAERAQAIAGAQAELADLVVAATQKVITKGSMDKLNRDMVKEAVEESKHA
jgi:F-type H+-transporting ATPase subunit b